MTNPPSTEKMKNRGYVSCDCNSCQENVG
ncbi:MAG: TRASH domain-containing protein [Firmicutes bacterium]|nr:TRASH domain-containing protein [Bacillota bacterium]